MLNRVGWRLRKHARLALVCAVVLLVAGCDSNDNENSEPAEPITGSFEATVVSSPADAVSGGIARVGIQVPDGLPVSDVAITVNGNDVSDQFSTGDAEFTLIGRVTDLLDGDNALEVSSTGAELAPLSLTLVNYSDKGPIFSGPQQQPFFCSIDEDLEILELGPYTDDNCSVERRVTFKYRTTSGTWTDWTPGQVRPDDMATTTTLDGTTTDFIVRWERGTINRFLYSLAVLVSGDDVNDEPNLDVWNKRLIYYFEGGVGIGHYQGFPFIDTALYADGLGLGYAVAYSTGTTTETHYNLQLGGETAIMVKDRFVSAYGKPDYTVGLGLSGGSVQQHIYSQNHPGLIDAGIPQLSYPDMITQVIHVADCELLERWIDVEISFDPNSKWANWENRSWLIGLNAIPGFPNDVLRSGWTEWLPPGASECTASWRRLSPLVLNPKFTTTPGLTPEEFDEVEWTHYADLINIYGRAADGYARSNWDNVGVQYGLQALLDGNISPIEFLDINASVGSWKEEGEMVLEGCPLNPELCLSVDYNQPLYPNQIDPWSWRNANVGSLANPAPRRAADPGAIERAFESGMVNRGEIEIPLIDLRPYLEGQLDMHNSRQSFVTRQRLLDADGDASNQVIWFQQPPEGDYPQNIAQLTVRALGVIDDWMANIKANPEVSVGENKPAEAVDACFNEDASVIAEGPDVWDGILDDKPAGACTQVFPIYGTSRTVAGAPFRGDVFKCDLQPVADAIAAGVYGDWVPNAQGQALLETIFPEGVCDYD